MTADFRNRFSSYLCPLNFFVLCSFLVFLEAGCDSRSPEKQGTGLADANAPPASNPIGPGGSERPDGSVQSEIPESPAGSKNRTGPVGSAESVDLSSLSRQELIDLADTELNHDHLDSAIACLRTLLVRDPEDVEVIFRLAGLRANAGLLEEAVDLLDSIPEDHPEAGLAALGQKADWCLELQWCARAETNYLKVLSAVPDASMAHRQLGRLLNQQGRRQEAAYHVRELCRLGDVRQQELQSLIVVGDAMETDLPSLNSDDPSHQPWIASSLARQLFTKKQYREAAATLRPILDMGDARPAVWALYGLASAEAQDTESFRWWAKTVSASAQLGEQLPQYSEYWTAIGVVLADERKPKQAIGALVRALEIDGTDFRAVNRMIRMFELLQMPEQVEWWENRWREYREILRDSNLVAANPTPDTQSMKSLSSRLASNGRSLEAVVWGYLSDYHSSAPAEHLSQWNAERQRLVAGKEGFPSAVNLRGDLQLTDYPAPSLSDLSKIQKVDSAADDPQGSLGVRSLPPAVPPRFRNLSEKLGVQHVFQIADQPKASAFLMHQQLGGGVAVLDFDRDGYADLFFSQGKWLEEKQHGVGGNELYRNLNSQFSDVSPVLSEDSSSYTIGCTVGDWNQDGFPDLVTSGMGWSHLLINNGDGTYSDHLIPDSQRVEEVPSSLALADLDQDGLPDLYQVTYLKDENLFREPPMNKQGRVIEAHGPNAFGHGQDRIGVNDGKGGLDWHVVGNREQDVKPGLGVVITNLDGEVGNEIFVGNDSTANQLWKYQREQQEYQDLAMVKGIAFSSGGAGTASMGIAAADFDRNGELDFHIANFQGEPVCLYLQNETGFRDRANQLGLGAVSLPVLGFGSQAVDYDNSGSIDLLVTNGHVDDYLQMQGTFQQPPQLFVNQGDHFEALSVQDESRYWSTGHVGRAMAKVDFNRDGQMDLILTHLGERSALLQNQTSSDYHWLQLELVGTDSERDAVGARVEVLSAGVRDNEWLVTGDGYLCRNEQVLSFGLGNRANVTEVRIHWPNGNSQRFVGFLSDHRYQLIEGQVEPHLLW